MDPIRLDDTAEALIRGVAAAPLDDAPRLAFADRLDETGREAEALWARLIRVQIEVSRYKLANEGHLPSDPRAATPADLAQVRPRHVLEVLGLAPAPPPHGVCPGDEWAAGWLADLVRRLPGLPPGKLVAENATGRPFSPFRGAGPARVGLTTDVAVVDLFTDRLDGLAAVCLWRGFPAVAEYWHLTPQGAGVLGGLYQAVPTFAVRRDLDRPEPPAVRAALARVPGLSGGSYWTGARPVLAGVYRVRRGDQAVVERYWAAGTSLAPAAPADTPAGPGELGSDYYEALLS